MNSTIKWVCVNKITWFLVYFLQFFWTKFFKAFNFESNSKRNIFLYISIVWAGANQREIFALVFRCNPIIETLYIAVVQSNVYWTICMHKLIFCCRCRCHISLCVCATGLFFALSLPPSLSVYLTLSLHSAAIFMFWKSTVV